MSEVLYTAHYTGQARTDGVRVVPADTPASPTVQKLRERFPQGIQQVEEFRGDYAVTLASPKDLLPMAAFLRNDPELGFRQLDDVTSQDRLTYPGLLAGAPRFCTVYHL